MADGQSGLTPPSMSCLLFLRRSERVLAWYAHGHALIRDLHSHIYLAGVLTSECSLCWHQRSPFGVYRQ
jgi:hypothetical protein